MMDTRISKKADNYFFTSSYNQFTPLGIGAAFFNDLNGSSRNLGGMLSGAFHFSLGKKSINYLSLGVSWKGVYNIYNPDSLTDINAVGSATKMFYSNLDAGIYIYGPSYFAGLSVTNLLGNPENADSLGNYRLPVSMQYNALAGFKIILYRPLNIILEPSVIINLDEPEINDIADQIKPLLNLYLNDFCLGTYFYDQDKWTFFFQYKYPRIYLGTYFEFRKNTVFRISQPYIEITAGINLPGGKRQSGNYSRW